MSWIRVSVKRKDLFNFLLPNISSWFPFSFSPGPFPPNTAFFFLIFFSFLFSYIFLSLFLYSLPFFSLFFFFFLYPFLNFSASFSSFLSFHFSFSLLIFTLIIFFFIVWMYFFFFLSPALFPPVVYFTSLFLAIFHSNFSPIFAFIFYVSNLVTDFSLPYFNSNLPVRFYVFYWLRWIDRWAQDPPPRQ